MTDHVQQKFPVQGKINIQIKIFKCNKNHASMLNTDKNPLFWAIQSSEQPQLTSILIIKTFYKQVKSYSNFFFFKCAVQSFKQT